MNQWNKTCTLSVLISASKTKAPSNPHKIKTPTIHSLSFLPSKTKMEASTLISKLLKLSPLQ